MQALPYSCHRIGVCWGSPLFSDHDEWTHQGSQHHGLFSEDAQAQISNLGTEIRRKSEQGFAGPWYIRLLHDALAPKAGRAILSDGTLRCTFSRLLDHSVRALGLVDLDF